jgi:hypothetical protein
VHFCGGGLPTQNGWAVLPPKDSCTLLLKVKGRREGVEDVVRQVRDDNTTEQQGEVAPASVVRVLVGVESPPSIGCGWGGKTLSGGLGAQGLWQQLVLQQGRACWRIIQS